MRVGSAMAHRLWRWNLLFQSASLHTPKMDRYLIISDSSIHLAQTFPFMIVCKVKTKWSLSKTLISMTSSFKAAQLTQTAQIPHIIEIINYIVKRMLLILKHILRIEDNNHRFFIIFGWLPMRKFNDRKFLGLFKSGLRIFRYYFNIYYKIIRQSTL